MAPRVTATPRTIAAQDGFSLAATLFRPTAAEPERVVVVGAAIGVRRGFYEPYARYLAGSGCAVYTFDYRGIGGSLKTSIADARATLRDWGERDYPGIIETAAREFPGRPLLAVGHSIGGQLLGLVPDLDRLSAVCTVAAQHGYWRRYPLKQALGYGAVWYLLVPLSTSLLSYFPGKRLRLGEDLPRGVAREWARFAKSPHYLAGRGGAPLHAGFQSFRGAVLAYSLDDDARAPARSVRALHRYYEQARSVEYRSVAPRAVGADAIGHIGFFTPRFKHTLWKDNLTWLSSH